jgi:Fic family protein
LGELAKRSQEAAGTRDLDHVQETIGTALEHLKRVLEPRGRENVKQIVARANDEYWPWHVLKYKAMPDGITPEIVWLLVKSSRSVGQPFSLRDVEGRPFQYWTPPSGQEHLHYLDRFLGGVRPVEHPGALRWHTESYLVRSLMEEAIASSLLEGAATTRPKAKEMLRTGRAPRDRAETMVLNNYRTVERIKEVARQPLSPALLIGLHASITHDTLDDPEMCGRFRTAENHVVVGDPLTGDVLHTLPPAGELPARMDALYRFANDEEDVGFMHPIVRAMLLHFWLAYDHPFVDGNGRTARALFYWYLLRKEYGLVEFLSISRAILRAPVQYRRAFIWSERDDRDATYFVMFHLRKLRQAVEDLHKDLGRKQEALKESEAALDTVEGLSHRQRELLAHALRHPNARYTIEYHRNCHRVAYATARVDLLTLGRSGLLGQGTVGRRVVFMPAPDLAEKLGKGP